MQAKTLKKDKDEWESIAQEQKVEKDSWRAKAEKEWETEKHKNQDYKKKYKSLRNDLANTVQTSQKLQEANKGLTNHCHIMAMFYAKTKSEWMADKEMHARTEAKLNKWEQTTENRKRAWARQLRMNQHLVNRLAIYEKEVEKLSAELKQARNAANSLENEHVYFMEENVKLKFELGNLKTQNLALQQQIASSGAAHTVLREQS